MPRTRTRTRSSTTLPIEDDDDNSDYDEEDFERLIRQRRASKLGGTVGHGRSRRSSSVFFDEDGNGRRRRLSSRSGRASEEGGSVAPEEEKAVEENVFENIKLQKEIIHNLRKQPWRMRKKLRTLRMSKAYVEKYEGRLSKGQEYREVWSKYQLRLKRSIDNFVTRLTPWEMKIKQIESHFGSVVSSYFVFLRWVFFINFVVAAFFCGIVVVPEFMFGDPESSRKLVPPETLNSSLDLASIWAFEGYLQYTFFFYGYYSNENLKIQALNAHYFLPLAYLLVPLASFGYCLVTIMKRMAANSRLSKISTDDEQFTFCWKVYSSWDFMIGNSETANNKAAALTTSFKESIIEEEEKMKKATQKRLTIFLRLLANFLVLLVLAGSSYAVYTVVQRSIEFEQRVNLHPDQPLSWWEANEVSVSMSLITLLFPSIFDLIGMMEGFHPRVALRWSLARILVLYLMNLYTLVIALQLKIQAQLDLIGFNARAYNSQYSYYLGNITTVCPSPPVPIDLASMETTVAPSGCTNVTAMPPPKKPNAYCWETMVGQEMYKLTMMDLVMTVGGILVIDFLRGLFVRYANQCWCWDLESAFPEYGEFKIAENILHLIYNQGMIWMGMFFAPALPALNIFKLLAMLYMRAWAVIVCNIPHERVFKASRSNNFYFALLLMMLFVCAFPVGYCMVAFSPSPDCGPFSHREYMYDEIIMVIKDELPPTVYSVLNVIASSAVIVPVFILLIMSIYYLLSLTKSLKEANADLKEQLIYERTEEKKKIYAMADARNEAQKNKEKTENKKRQEAKVAPAVASKSKPKDGISEQKNQMVKIISGNKEKIISLGHLQQLVKNQPAGSSKGEPQVALVHGKQSLIDRRSKRKRAPTLADVVNDARSRRDDRSDDRHGDDDSSRRSRRSDRRYDDDDDGDDDERSRSRSSRERRRQRELHRKASVVEFVDERRGRESEKSPERRRRKKKKRKSESDDESGREEKSKKNRGRRTKRNEENSPEHNEKKTRKNRQHSKDKSTDRNSKNKKRIKSSKERIETSDSDGKEKKKLSEKTKRDKSRSRSRDSSKERSKSRYGEKRSRDRSSRDSRDRKRSKSRDGSRVAKKGKRERRSSSESSARSKNSLDDNYVRNVRKLKESKRKKMSESESEESPKKSRNRKNEKNDGKKKKRKTKKRSETESASTESTDTEKDETKTKSESESESEEGSESKTAESSSSSESETQGRFKKNPKRKTSIVAAQINRAFKETEPHTSRRVIPKILVEDKEVDSDNWKRNNKRKKSLPVPPRKVSLPELDLEHTDSSLSRMLKSKPNKNARPPSRMNKQHDKKTHFLQVDDENQSESEKESETVSPTKATAWGRLKGKLVKPKAEVEKPKAEVKPDVAEVKLETIGRAGGSRSVQVDDQIPTTSRENNDTVIDVDETKELDKRRGGRGFAFLRSVVTLKKSLKKGDS